MAGSPHDRRTDNELLADLAQTDPMALRVLMDRFDRLVRFTIFRTSRQRCRQDPLWIDSVASEVWTDLCRSARAGNVVIGGWGGQVLLKDRPDVFHLRIVGSDESRTRHIMNSAGVPRVQAEEIVESTDRNQNLFSNYFFKADFSDPKLYHAVINIDRTSPDEICDIVPLMLGEMKTPSLQSD